jgi:hypothetical protein
MLPMRNHLALLLATLMHAMALTPTSMLTPPAQRLAAGSTTHFGDRSDGRLTDAFLKCFQGHFDNHGQVVADRAAGLEPREGGGHEHIHCHVRRLALSPSPSSQPPAEAFLLASYYFDGKPECVFRERLYSLHEVSSDVQFGRCVQMRIFQLRESMETELRAAAGTVDALQWSSADVADSLHIPGADVFWRRRGDRFEGKMRTESVLVHSARQGMPIVVRDDVTLWHDALWVNDRGYDTEGNYLYGNVRNVPYQMDRVPDDHWTAR